MFIPFCCQTQTRIDVERGHLLPWRTWFASWQSRDIIHRDCLAFVEQDVQRSFIYAGSRRHDTILPGNALFGCRLQLLFPFGVARGGGLVGDFVEPQPHNLVRNDHHRHRPRATRLRCWLCAHFHRHTSVGKERMGCVDVLHDTLAMEAESSRLSISRRRPSSFLKDPGNGSKEEASRHPWASKLLVWWQGYVQEPKQT